MSLPDMTLFTPRSEPVALGASGPAVFPLAWGMWRLADRSGKDDMGAICARIEAALEAGVTLFDTADIYGADTPTGFGHAETLFGRALAANPGWRKHMVIATKGGIELGKPYDSSPAYLEKALDASLARLGLDYVDLYQVHRRDFLAHPRDVARALAAMVEAGKVRQLGVSNYSPAELAALQAFLPVPLVTTQPEFSAAHIAPLYDGTLDDAMKREMAVLAWSPLGGGRLIDPADPVGRLLEQQGADFGTDASAAALSWIMVHPARIIPIVGTQRPERIARLGEALQVEWTAGQWYAVLAAARGAPMP